MKPNFALILSFQGISLLHRAVSGWDRVGEVSLDAPNLAASLDQLRERGLAIAPDGLRTKLVLPNDQIRFFHFEADGANADDLGDAVRYHLEGKTPYSLDELAHDWSVSAGQVFVAAVARETLSEAEIFAAQHGFEPLCFVGAPEARDFVGEPWFGQTKHGAAVLSDGESLERDTAAVRITGVVPAPLPDSDDLSAPDPNAPQVAVEDDVSWSDTNPEALPSEPDASSEIVEDTPFSEPEDLPEKPDLAPAPPAMNLTFATRRDPQDAAIGTESQSPEETAEAAPATDPPPITAFGVSDEVTSENDVSKDVDVTDERSEVAIPAQMPSFRISDEVAAFETNRSVSGPAQDRGASPMSSGRAPDTIRAVRSDGATQPARFFGTGGKGPVNAAPKQLVAIATAAVFVLLAGVATWMFLFDGGETVQQDADAAQTVEPAHETALVQTNDQDIEQAPDSIPSEQNEIAPGTNAEPVLPDALEAGNEIPAVLSETVETPVIDDTGTGRETTSLTEAEPALSDDTDTRDLAEVAGIWQGAPETLNVPPSQSLEDLYRTSIDPDVRAQDALALPGATAFATDPQPEPMANPAPAGARFDVDERGLVRATPDGAITPDGVTVFAGRPQLLPPPRPAETLTPEPEPADETPERVERQTSDPGELRPRSRPNDLQERTERAALGSGGRTQAELAALRPNVRPPSAQELALQEGTGATAESGPTEEAEGPPFAGATAQAVATSMIPRSRPENFESLVASARQAAEQSARAAAEAAAQREAAQATQQTQQAQQPSVSSATQSASAQQPVLEPEDTRRSAAAAVPRNQRVTPRNPTASSVARAATEKNALSLRRVNLIGVYGGPSDRRALVRLANGRYKKVQVGDRLDGGRVTAIGASELRYSKNGRDVALKMPQG